MTGEYYIEAYNKRVHFKIHLRRNITILRGDSGTGKTTLLSLIDAYDAGDTSNVTVKCTANVPCAVLERRSWKQQVSVDKATIFFADEDSRFIYTKEFATCIKGTKHYFVFVTRHESNLAMIPYSVSEIYNLQVTGRYPVQKRMVTVNETIPVLHSNLISVPLCVKQVLTEDTGTGFEFFSYISNGKCVSAGGKSSVPSMLRTLQEPTLVVVDGAAFGSELEKVMRLYTVIPKFAILYLPESFEWFLLHSIMFQHYKMLQRKLETPSKYIESAEYISWERYFTSLLSEYCGKVGIKYSKGGKLNTQFYTQQNLQCLYNKLLNTVQFDFR